MFAASDYKGLLSSPICQTVVCVFCVRPRGSKFEVVQQSGFKAALPYEARKNFATHEVQEALTLLFMISSQDKASGKCMDRVSGW